MKAETESSRGPSAYQPNAVPLGKTGSQHWPNSKQRFTTSLEEGAGKRCSECEHWRDRIFPPEGPGEERIGGFSTLSVVMIGYSVYFPWVTRALAPYRVTLMFLSDTNNTFLVQPNPREAVAQSESESVLSKPNWARNRSLSFIPRSRSNNQSDSSTKFYNSSEPSLHFHFSPFQ